MESKFKDFLSHRYYHPGNDGLINKINNYLPRAIKVPFFHPFICIQNGLPTTIQKYFGTVNILWGSDIEHHHSNVDMHPNTLEANIFSAHDSCPFGNTYSEIDHHNGTTIKDSTDKDEYLIGKFVIIYLHPNLDKDTAELFDINEGQIRYQLKSETFLCSHQWRY
ncbi:MAG: hypothetical protein ACFFEK_15055 [Candidatus Thorarchaeota archaeon]